MIIGNKSRSVAQKFFCSDIFMVVLIIVFSLVTLSIITFGNPNVFLVDDNILQWEPIINKSFDNLFSEGYIPYIDFYQYKMFNVLDCGYYSLNNPIMLIAYILGRFIFESRLGSICIYIYIMFVLGNVVMYLLLRRLNISKLNTCIAVLIYSSVSNFILYGFYYFTFNNYFFIPFLLLVILSFDKSKFSYFATGICLAFSLLLGHIQYTFYYYMVYGIVMFVIAFAYNRRYLMIMFTNIVVGIILSAPQLVALVSISGNRSEVIGTANEFLKIPMLWDNMIIFFAIPLYFVGETYQMINAGGALREELDYLSTSFVYLGALVPLYAVFLVVFFKKILHFILNNIEVRSLSLSKKIGNKNMTTLSGIFCFISIGILLIWSLIISNNYFVSGSNIYIINKFIYFMITVMIILALIFMRMSQRNGIEKWQKWIVGMLMIYYPLATVVIATYYFLNQKIIHLGGAFPHFCSNNIVKKTKSLNYYIVIGSVVASIFFILLSIGESGGIAIVLSKIPIINSFRFLYKCEFIFIPLMVIPAAFALNNIKKKRKSVIFGVVMLSLIGISNSCYLMNSGLHTYSNNSRYCYNSGIDYTELISSTIDKIGTDKNNYRFLAITEGNESFADGSYTESASVDFCDKMTKNMSTMVGVFTLAGYDNTFTKMSYEQSNLILNDINLNNMYTNAINGYKDLNKLVKLTDNDPKIRKLYYQLKYNSVKYYLFDKNATKSLDAFKRLCDKIPELSIIREVDFVNDTILIEIDGVDSLCKTNDGKSIPLNSKMAELNFNLDKESTKYITLSFTYDKNYRAVLRTPDGSEKELDVVNDDLGYTRIITQNVGAGIVTLYYDNILDNLVIAFSAVICILLICIIARMLICRNRE